MSDLTVGRVEFFSDTTGPEFKVLSCSTGYCCCAAKDARIAELEAENAELRKDKARLDWLGALVIEDQYDFDIAIQSDHEDGVWVSRIWRRNSGNLRGVALDGDADKTEDIRAAIDAAMKWEPMERKG
jgi:hypothetical protein